jgi:3-phenylpropionate/trans-cinnamate dioxygenase ferredoxin subunit
MSADWVTLCKVADVAREDVLRADVGDTTLVVVHTKDGNICVLAGECTHGRAHLAEGFVHGSTIECPKHNGRFDAVTGTAAATPARVALEVFDSQVVDGEVQVRMPSASEAGRRES